MLKRAGPMLFLFALILVAPSAKANIVAPGMSNSADPISFAGHTMGLVASAGGLFTAVGGSPSGTWTESVYTDSAGLCPGCLDFLINLSVTKGETLRISIKSFAGFVTDLGFIAAGPFFVAGHAPLTVDRSDLVADVGATVGFNFPLPTAPATSVACPVSYGASFTNCGAVKAGDTTVTLVIATNAKKILPGQLNLIDGGTTSFSALAVAAEPASTVLLGVSLLMGGVFRKKLFA